LDDALNPRVAPRDPGLMADIPPGWWTEWRSEL